MSCDLIGNLERDGFVICPMGGNLRVMVRRLGACSVVISSFDGADLPYEMDFLVAVYVGDWLDNPDAPEAAAPISSADYSDTEFPPSGLHPIDDALAKAREIAREKTRQIEHGKRTARFHRRKRDIADDSLFCLMNAAAGRIGWRSRADVPESARRYFDRKATRLAACDSRLAFLHGYAFSPRA